MLSIPATQDCLIATFHSMCVRILRRDADHIGYNRNFTIVDPGEQRTLMKRILKNLNLDPKKWVNVLSWEPFLMPKRFD